MLIRATLVFIICWMVPSGRTSIADLPVIGDLVNDKCIFLEDICPNGNISFWLYNRDHHDDPYLLDAGSSANLLLAPFSDAKELVVLIHGYTGNRDYSPNTELRPAYLHFHDYNIITVDWGKAAQEPCYVHAAYNVERVGQCIAELLGELYQIRSDVLSLENTHVVGFSLGAHTAGSLGKRYKRMFDSQFPRITGLDPALPLFDSLLHSAEYFLDVSDARFVDVIHTNAGTKGRLSQVGHADFYVNNAGIQPGCFRNSSCDHVRSVEVFAESIASEVGFWGIRCRVQAAEFLIGFVSEACTLLESYTTPDPFELMGEHVSTSASGTFLVQTNSAPPYAKGKWTLKYRGYHL